MNIAKKLYYTAAVILDLTVALGLMWMSVRTGYVLLAAGAVAGFAAAFLHAVNFVFVKFGGRKTEFVKNMALCAILAVSSAVSLLITGFYAHQARYIENAVFAYIIMFLSANVFMSITFSLFYRGLVLKTDRAASLGLLVSTLCVLFAGCVSMKGGQAVTAVFFIMPSVFTMCIAVYIAVKELRARAGFGLSELEELSVYYILSEEYDLTVDRLKTERSEDGKLCADIEVSERLCGLVNTDAEDRIRERLISQIVKLKDVRICFG